MGGLCHATRVAAHVARAMVISAALLTTAAITAARGAEARELKVATWDFGWLTARPAGDPALPPSVAPKRAEDLARLRRYADVLNADIVAFQGVDGAAMAAQMFPPDRYALFLSGDAILQRPGFAVRRGLPVAQEPDLTSLDLYRGAPLHLRSGVQLTLSVPGGRALRLLDVHLKGGCRDAPLDDAERPACATLGRQAGALHAWIAAREAARDPFLILGDFARIMDDPDAFLPMVAGGATLLRATAHSANPCWGGGNFVDHILAGGGARDWLEPGSLRVLVYREKQPAWRDRLSDHCPVSVRLRLPD